MSHHHDSTSERICQMTDNLQIYNDARAVPQEAQKEFNNGRFKGTDINPMWRIKKLTELFGAAGVGWYTDDVEERFEEYGDTVIAIVTLKLYVKVDGEWSKPIYGTGGNQVVSKGRVSDEGYKMAYTDALSVACKALGIGADIYFANDVTKYTQSPVTAHRSASTPKVEESTSQPNNPVGRAANAANEPMISAGQIKFIHSVCTEAEVDALKAKYKVESLKDITRAAASKIIEKLQERGR